MVDRLGTNWGSTVREKRLQVLWNRQNGIALGILLSCLAVCGWLVSPNINWVMVNWLTPTGFQQVASRLGIVGPIVYIGIIALSVVISPIPGAPLAVVAGGLWGAIPAGVYSVIGGFLGSLIAYYLGRTLGRSGIKALTGKAIYFSKRRGQVYLGWLIFITRLLPVLSFDLMSYGAGITGISLKIYAIATLLGMIPSTLLLTYLGSTFTIGGRLGMVLSLMFLLLLFGLPWGIKRFNWLGLRDVIRVE